MRRSLGTFDFHGPTRGIITSFDAELHAAAGARRARSGPLIACGKPNVVFDHSTWGPIGHQTGAALAIRTVLRPFRGQRHGTQNSQQGPATVDRGHRTAAGLGWRRKAERPVGQTSRNVGERRVPSGKVRPTGRLDVLKVRPRASLEAAVLFRDREFDPMKASTKSLR